MFWKSMLALGVVVFAVIVILTEAPILTAVVMALWVAGTPYALLRLIVPEES